jgi:hypothetical protein
VSPEGTCDDKREKRRGEAEPTEGHCDRAAAFGWHQPVLERLSSSGQHGMRNATGGGRWPIRRTESEDPLPIFVRYVINCYLA